MSQEGGSPNKASGSFMDEFGGSVVNVLLGGMLLWVGQTTFEHNGELAGVNQQLESLNARHETLHDRYDHLVDSLNSRTKGRFTADDGDKLSKRIDSVQLSAQGLREQLQDRLAELRVQVSALEVQIQSSTIRTVRHEPALELQEVQQIQAEMSSLRNEVSRLTRALNAVYKKSTPPLAPAGDATAAPRQASYQVHTRTTR